MRTGYLLAFSVSIVAACGGSRARPDPVGQGGAEACPATYAEAEVRGACSDTEASCAFAEGRCWCGPRSYCGGVAPPDELLEELARPTWQCRPLRTDGCPEAPPSGICTDEGKTCVYGDCCRQVVACTAGAWVAGEESCPP